MAASFLMDMHNTMSRRIILGLAATALSFGAVACGDDDEGSSGSTTPVADSTVATPTTGATATSGATDGTDAVATDVDAFCQAELAAEAAVSSEDPAVIGPAFEAFVAAAPADMKATAEAVIANAEAGPGSPEFDEPYGELIGFMKENCGFAEFDVEAAEYSFTGLPPETAAGPAIFTLENVGEEVHEMLLLRVNDDVTDSAVDIASLPEEEAFSKVAFKAAAFGFPGVTTYAVADLEPGRYIAVCFLPEGATPEVMEEMMAEGGGPEGSVPEGSAPEGSTPEGSVPEGSAPGGEEPTPHFALGMIQEFQVS